MVISVFGLGYVGCVTMACLAKCGHKVIGVDVNRIKLRQINKGESPIIEKDVDTIIREAFSNNKIFATSDYINAIQESEISFITVGTPSKNNGGIDLSSVFAVAEQFGNVLADKAAFHTIVIRSTITPGTSNKFASIIEKHSGKRRNKDFAVACQPEFLREGSAVYDFFNPPYTLFGTDNKPAAQYVATLYKDLRAEIIYTEIEEAEILKFVNNSFHALKICFANEVGNICSALNIDSHKVMELFCKDKKLNISSVYLKPGFAYGGSCLPKDVSQLQELADENYLKTPVLTSIDISNKLQISRALDTIISLDKRKLGFLGLSFKAGTDDLRNSPAVAIIKSLIGQGYDILAYDKNINLSKLIGANHEFIEAHLPDLSTFICEHIESVIEKSEVIIVVNGEAEYLRELEKSDLSEKIILDMVGSGEPIKNKKLVEVVAQGKLTGDLIQ